MMNKIELSQFKIVMMASAIMISGVAIFSVQEIPEAEANSQPFIGEIMWAGFNFPPRGWAFCDGQTLPIAQNTALFAIVGTIYGGDGRTTLGLPNLQGKAMMHQGNGPGLTPRTLGQSDGTVEETISLAQIGSHSHVASVNVNNDELGNDTDPAGEYLSKQWRRAFHDSSGVTTTDTLAGTSLGNTGDGLPHTNLQPYQVVNCNIALVGTFPSRN